MILRQITVLSPTGESVVLGAWTHGKDGMVDPGSWTFDSFGNASGFTLEEITMHPAPVVVRRRHFPTFAGGVVASGRADIRDVTLTGTIVASSLDAANKLRRQLIRVCGDPYTSSTKLMYTPEAAVGQVALSGIVEKVEVTEKGGFHLGYSIAFVAGDPHAQSTTPTTAQFDVTAHTADATNRGDVEISPTINLHLVYSSALSGLEVRVRNTTTGGHLIISNLPAPITYSYEQGSGSVQVTGLPLTIVTRPGYENISYGSDPSTNLLSHRVAGTTWPTMAPGNNHFTLTLTGVNLAEGSLTWNDGWSA